MVVVVALVAFNTGSHHPAGPAAQSSASAKPNPTSTTTVRQPPPSTVTTHENPPSTVVAPQPQYGGDDEEFLSMIAADGIKAPDGWAIQAGRATCGRSYDYSFNYLTDGGIHSNHVQTFLDDWSATHAGC